ncbi:MAG: right-handed parallel beta-helix repeat-containing protein, partial [Spirochaetaceae bacterium]|nr:right-handed parallel beta-helix repeat-containing protein [Spirochaetaceae bacterium]
PEIKISGGAAENPGTPDEAVPDEAVPNGNGWYTQEVLRVKAEDSLSGLKSFTVNGKEEGNGETKELTQNGIYKIEATDNAGNKAGNGNEGVTIKLDNRKPDTDRFDISFEKEEGEGKESRLITKIKTAAKAKEEGENSGLGEMYIKNVKSPENPEGVILAGGKLAEENRKEKELTAWIENIDRTKANTYEFKVTAKDLAGNEAEREYGRITLPPEIELRAGKTYTEGGQTVTELKLGRYDGNEESYEKLKLKRRIYIEGTEITEENFTKYFEEEARETWRNLTSWKAVEKEEIEDGIYKDRIPGSSGFGHKETGYVISWEVRAGTEDGNAVREESAECRTVTADSRGKVRIMIEGRGGQLEVDFESGKAAGGEGEIRLSGDGGIRIGVCMEDEDCEPQEVEVRQKAGSGEGSVCITKSGFIQRGTTGKAKYEGYERRYGDGGWNWYENREYLSYNRVIRLYVRVKSGYSGNKAVTESGEIYLKAENKDSGGYILKVCDKAEYSERGITANPYQKIRLELEGEIQDADWDYGDGTEERSKVKVEHSWKQKEGRSGDTSEYELKIKADGKKEAVIPVHITDTKSGRLYGDEVWLGRHEVLGKIEIPEGVKLLIGSGGGREEQEIICMADEEEGYSGCIQVNGGGNFAADSWGGKLRIVSGINTKEGIAELENKEKTGRLYWNGIEVLPGGKSEVSGIEISGSRRAIAVDKDGFATIKKSVLRENMTALHIFGECKAEETEIRDNEEYGIKEEEGSRCEIKKSEIYGNTVDWYEKENGPLGEEEISAKVEG